MKTCLSRVALLPLALLCSCAAEDGRTPVFPVQGTLLYRGAPAEGALVIFNPAETSGHDGLAPSGTVQADGSFQLTTYETGDGAPPGSYRMTVRWPQPPENPLEPPDMGPDRLGNRFIDPQKSPWEVEVREDNNRLDPIQID